MWVCLTGAEPEPQISIGVPPSAPAESWRDQEEVSRTTDVQMEEAAHIIPGLFPASTRLTTVPTPSSRSSVLSHFLPKPCKLCFGLAANEFPTPVLASGPNPPTGQ